MKILTIAAPRSGGFYFTKYLSDLYKLKHFHEPSIDAFDYITGRYKNISIKVHVEQLYKHYELGLSLNRSESIDRIYHDVSNYEFDNIFLLDRRNRIEHAEAMLNVFYYKKDMRAKWSVNDDEFIKIKNSEKWKFMLDYAESVSIWLDELSNKFNLPKIYYEDLFYNTNKVDLQGLEFKPDIANKLRYDGPPKMI